MNNFFLEAMELLKKQRSGVELNPEEQTTLNAAMIALDRTYDDIPVEDGLKKLATLLEPSWERPGYEFWLLGSGNGSFPLAEVVRHDGRIAELVKASRKPHRCRVCPEPIQTGEPYYQVTYGGGGLGNIKYPNRVHAVCLPQYILKPATTYDISYLWGKMFDYAHQHCGEMMKKNTIPGYTAAMQRIWAKSQERKNGCND